MVLPGGAEGLVAGSVTGDVTLQYVDKSEKVKVGQYVVTSGRKGSIFVARHPDRPVESVGSQDVELYQSIVGASRSSTSASSTSCRWSPDERSTRAADDEARARLAGLARGRAARRRCCSSPCCCRRRWRPTCASSAPTPTSRSSSSSASALRQGSETGAVFGFLTGMLVAIALIEPLRPERLRLRAHRLLRRPLRGDRGPVGRLRAAASPSSSATLRRRRAASPWPSSCSGAQVPLGFFLGRVLVPSLVLNTLLAAPLYLLVRVWLQRGR